MTVIVGLKHEGKIYMGADSAGTAKGDCLHLNVQPSGKKIFKNGPFLIGTAGSPRMGQLFRYEFFPPKHPSKMGIDRFIVTIFVNALKECLGRESAELDGTFLIGYRGELFKINNNSYQIDKVACNYNAIGCGTPYAKGAMFATEHIKSPRKRIMIALEAAERFSAGVRRPFKILMQKNK